MTDQKTPRGAPAKPSDAAEDGPGGDGKRGERPVKRRRNPGVAPESTSASPTSAASGSGGSREAEAQIRALEERLDGMIRGATKDDPSPPSVREQVESIASEVASRIAHEIPNSGDAGVGAAARELLSSEFYARNWGRLGLRNRSEAVDDFGLDPTYEKRIQPLLDFLGTKWFRTEVAGVENIPNAGRCVVVANHSGTLPLDGPMLRAAVRREHPSARELRWLAEDFVYYVPFLGAFMSRVGAVRACQENAERLLERHDALVAVFPEGVKGIGKLYRDRYKLQRFGRGGFIRLCLRTQTPLVPCAIVGAEEANPMLYRLDAIGKLLGLPYVPVTPTFPLLGPAGLLPAPTKWRIEFGNPIHFDGYGVEAAEDTLLVGRLAERVRSSIEDMLAGILRTRESVWKG